MHKLRRFGFNAIKESFDRLPTGVCFFDRTGSIVLCNRRMYQLSRFLLDSDMQYLGEVQEALSAPTGGVVRIPDIDNTYRFPDKTVWRFEKTEVTDRYGVSYIQLTAADVTDLQRALVQLTADSKKLQEDAEKLKQLSDNAGALAREKELLDAIDPVPFGNYAMQEEQGCFTSKGYLTLSGDEWEHERSRERQTEKKPSIKERLEQSRKECANQSKAQPHREKPAPER